MKTKLILLLLLCCIASIGIAFAQVKNFKPKVPDYRDTTLKRIIQEQYYIREGNTDDFKPKNVSARAYRDTINAIFTQFSVGKDNISKNINVLTAEVATKESRISYNAATYLNWPYKGVYNAELFAAGKDNLANIFGKAKTQGKFGMNLSSSFLLASTKFFNGTDRDKLHDDRLLYAWVLEEKIGLLTDAAKKQKVTDSIEVLKGQLNLGDLKGEKKEEIFMKLKKMEDSLVKFSKPETKEKRYIDELYSYDKKRGRWTGFRLWTMDIRVGLASEGFSYYTPVVWPTVYPDITENHRFFRWNVNVAGNWIINRRKLSNKLTSGLGYLKFIGFDGESPDEITQSTEYRLENVTRSIDEKYTAYAVKPGLLEKYGGINFTLGDQVLLGQKKMFGFGFSHSSTLFLDGKFNEKVAIDHTYSLLLALGKKGDVLNKNVLAINFTTPDLTKALPKSFDAKTKERLTTRQKLIIGVSFGLSIEKAFGL